MNEATNRVVRALREIRAPIIQSEIDQLHSLVEAALKSAQVPYLYEVPLGPRSRIDFLVDGGVVIECKKGKPNGPRLQEQIARYLKNHRVSSVIVLTTWKKHLHLPGNIGGKEVVILSLNELWGVAV